MLILLDCSFTTHKFIAIGIIAILFIVVKAIYLFDQFDPDTWGTVADWTIKLITAFTEIFILLRAQLKENGLELAKFRYQFLAYLKVKAENCQINVIVEVNTIVIVATFCSHRNMLMYNSSHHRYGEGDNYEVLMAGRGAIDFNPQQTCPRPVEGFFWTA